MSALHVFVVGHDIPSSSHLQSRLACGGIKCPPLSVATAHVARENLQSLPSQPDVVFFRCDPHKGDDASVLAQLRAMTSADIIAVGEETDSRRVIQLIRAGATDYLHDADEFHVDLSAIVSRIKSRSTGLSGQGVVISVLSASGGCGASSIAANLAACVAATGSRSCLFDCHLSGGDLAAMLNVSPQHTVVELCHQVTELDAEMLFKSLTKHPSGLELLACPNHLDSFDPISPESIEQVVRCAAAHFPYVVVDLEDVFHLEQLATLKLSRQILVVLRLEFACLLRAQRIIEFLQHHGISRERIQLVVNRHGQKNELPTKHVIEAIGQPIAHYLPEDYATAVHAINVGSPVVIESPSSKLAAALMKLSKSVAVIA